MKYTARRKRVWQRKIEIERRTLTKRARDRESEWQLIHKLNLSGSTKFDSDSDPVKIHGNKTTKLNHLLKVGKNLFSNLNLNPRIATKNCLLTLIFPSFYTSGSGFGFQTHGPKWIRIHITGLMQVRETENRIFNGIDLDCNSKENAYLSSLANCSSHTSSFSSALFSFGLLFFFFFFSPGAETGNGNGNGDTIATR